MRRRVALGVPRPWRKAATTYWHRWSHGFRRWEETNCCPLSRPTGTTAHFPNTSRNATGSFSPCTYAAGKGMRSAPPAGWRPPQKPTSGLGRQPRRGKVLQTPARGESPHAGGTGLDGRCARFHPGQGARAGPAGRVFLQGGGGRRARGRTSLHRGGSAQVSGRRVPERRAGLVWGQSSLSGPQKPLRPPRWRTEGRTCPIRPETLGGGRARA